MYCMHRNDHQAVLHVPRLALTCTACTAVGDGFILAAAAFYSMATVRLGLHARRLPTMQLAAYKSVVLAGISGVWLLGTAAALSFEDGSLLPLWPGYQNAWAWGLLAFSAVGPGALAAVLQTFVSPLLLYCKPLWDDCCYTADLWESIAVVLQTFRSPLLLYCRRL